MHHCLDITTLAITQTVVLVVALTLMLTAVGSVCVVCHVAFFSSYMISLRSILRKNTNIPLFLKHEFILIFIILSQSICRYLFKGL